ncbi:MAG: response regulator transcription factor [Vagococcus sp.]
MTILLIEDNDQLNNMLTTYLTEENYHVVSANNGEDGLALFTKHRVDLILLDIMLPGMDGFEICKHIRQTSVVPIIMITAKSEEHDKILGLDVGADDYIVKPFSHDEMGARIRAIMRRIDYTTSHTNKYDSLMIDTVARKVEIDHRDVHLTKKEFDLLVHFTEHPNQLFTRDHLLDCIWGFDYYGDFRTVDSHVKRLREKIKTTQPTNWSIKTIWGKGYLFEVES